MFHTMFQEKKTTDKITNKVWPWHDRFNIELFIPKANPEIGFKGFLNQEEPVRVSSLRYCPSFDVLSIKYPIRTEQLNNYLLPITIIHFNLSWAITKSPD